MEIIPTRRNDETKKPSTPEITPEISNIPITSKITFQLVQNSIDTEGIQQCKTAYWSKRYLVISCKSIKIEKQKVRNSTDSVISNFKGCLSISNISAVSGDEICNSSPSGILWRTDVEYFMVSR